MVGVLCSRDHLPIIKCPLAYALIDAGAHLVLGYHAHVLHGVEKYKMAL